MDIGIFIAALVLAAALGYLVGSLNMAILISRAIHGTDVRTLGSGNAGMTNVLRNFDKKSAALTMLGDTLKGVAAVLIGKGIVFLLLPGTDVMFGGYIAAIATILGHSFPVYFKFKGGKGVAASLGVILALTPAVAGVLLLIFIIMVLLFKMVSLGSVVAISFYAPFTYVWSRFISHRVTVFATVCAALASLFVVWLHRENIRRISNGAEYKFGQKKDENTRQTPE